MTRALAGALICVVVAMTSCSSASSGAGAPEPPSSVPTTTSTTPSAPATARPPHHLSSPTPVARHISYAYPIRGCTSSPSTSHHDYPASDIFTRRGCGFVAVTSGRVDEVSYVDRWDPSTDRGATRGGLSVSIVGDDGVRYYGSHLLRIARGIRPGVRVSAGDLLGLVDNSGDARYTPTHVHFGISWPTRAHVWWVRRGEIWPQRYLSAWRAGRDLSPVAEVRRAHRRAGDVPPCHVLC